jgi:hypothetical protein
MRAKSRSEVLQARFARTNELMRLQSDRNLDGLRRVLAMNTDAASLAAS